MLLQKFKEGFAWGIGFALAFFGLGYLLVATIASVEFGPNDDSEWNVIHSDSEIGSGDFPQRIPFSDRPVDDQIAQASVIVLITYKPSETGAPYRAIITEILKKENEVEFGYSLEDEYPRMSFYPNANTHYGDGAVVFFTDNASSMRTSYSYSGDRVPGLNNMPLSLLRQKCMQDANNGS